LGTASTLRVEGIDTGKQVQKFTNWRKRVQLKDHSIFVAFAPDNPKIAQPF
jgi:DNA gyrase inhibitor GyrI